MLFATYTSSQFSLYGGTSNVSSGELPRQVLEVEVRLFFHLIGRQQIFFESAPIPLQNAIFPLPLHELDLDDDPVFLQIYIAQSLALFDISAVLCETIAAELASYLLQLVAENREINFHIAAVVDYTQLTLVEETAIVEEAPRRMKMEKLEEIDEDLGDCSICLDKFINCNNREVVKIPCGHVYHQSCIFRWLHNTNSCPLGRTPLSFKVDEDSL